MQWVASALHTTSEHGVSSITTADAAHLGCQQSTKLTTTGRFKWTRPFRAKDEIWFLRVCHHISTGLYAPELGQAMMILCSEVFPVAIEDFGLPVRLADQSVLKSEFSFHVCSSKRRTPIARKKRHVSVYGVLCPNDTPPKYAYRPCGSSEL